MDCPSDCGYLVAAHRYEDQHQRELPPDTPLLDIRIPQDAIYAYQNVLSGIAFAAAKFCAEHPAATDPDVLAAIETLAQTYKTLSSGIYYEKPPALPLPRDLYAALAAFLEEAKKHPVERTSLPPVKDSEILFLLVFLYRMGLLRTNGRARARRFIEFLRGQFPAAPELQREESRIIVP